MRVQILRDGVLVGARSYSRGERADLSDPAGNRLVRLGAAIPAVELPAAVEAADLDPVDAETADLEPDDAENADADPDDGLDVDVETAAARSAARRRRRA